MLHLKTLIQLGLWNVAYIFWYRFSLKTGIRRFWFPTSQLPTDQDFFRPVVQRQDYPNEWKKKLVETAEKILSGQLCYYSFHWKDVGTPPNWFINPFNGKKFPNTQAHWTKLPDFHSETGDIKNIWEASRFDWVVTLSRAYAVTNDVRYLQTLNEWLKDWCKHNPLNIGPNWKCGQEVSIRVFNLINASFILQQNNNPTTALIQLIEAHLKRIQLNICYAIAQDNNHGTSEAAGLFIGGSWLSNINVTQKLFGAKSKAQAYTQKGRYWLENRVSKLISEDGSFSQHSVNYHRVMLDTLSFSEFWRLTNNEKPFSAHFYSKAKAATTWLYQLTDNHSGNAPNIGENDGAMLLNLHGCSYRDFRPSLELAGFLFLNKISLNTEAQEPLFWMKLTNKDNASQFQPRISKCYKSGYVTIIVGQTWSLLRFPFFKFRPSHNDVFHFDLWCKGINFICDAGTFSYNPPLEDQNIDLKSVHSHNTICFDENEQMPKLSRFLLGNWLKADKIGEVVIDKQGNQSWEGQYTDNFNNKHHRKISTNGKIWRIEDTITGNFKIATIGFNLNTTEAKVENTTCITPFAIITFSNKSNANAIDNLCIKNTIISEHYFQKRIIQRLNITVTQPGTYITVIHLT